MLRQKNAFEKIEKKTKKPEKNYSLSHHHNIIIIEESSSSYYFSKYFTNSLLQKKLNPIESHPQNKSSLQQQQRHKQARVFVVLKLTANFNLKPNEKREKLKRASVNIFLESQNIFKMYNQPTNQPTYSTTNFAGNISLVLYLYKQLEKQNRSTTTQKKIKYRCSSSTLCFLLKFSNN